MRTKGLREIKSLIFIAVICAGLGIFALFTSLKDKSSRALVSANLKGRAVRSSLKIGGAKGKKSPVVNPKKYIVINSKKAFKGLTLIPLSSPAQIWLINNKGEVLNIWSIDADRARLLPNGNLLVVHGSKYMANKEPWKGLRRTVAIYDWDGNVVWSYSSNSTIHHDINLLSNGNIIFIQKEEIKGDVLKKIKNSIRQVLPIRGDSLIEVNKAGKIVWQWRSWDFFDINFCGVKTCEERVEIYKNSLATPTPNVKIIRDWTHFNTVSEIPPNKWYEKGDKRFKPGNLIIMPRNFWTVYIIDKESKKIVWQYRGSYKGGIGAAHEPYMIPKGYPGEGNILLLDNGSDRKHPRESYVLEINPQTKKVVWVYDKGKAFYCRTRGVVKRLLNGNTFISNDMTSEILEVTPSGETVWKMKLPLHTSRASKYPISYCKICTAS